MIFRNASRDKSKAPPPFPVISARISTGEPIGRKADQSRRQDGEEDERAIQPFPIIGGWFRLFFSSTAPGCHSRSPLLRRFGSTGHNDDFKNNGFVDSENDKSKQDLRRETQVKAGFLSAFDSLREGF